MRILIVKKYTDTELKTEFEPQTERTVLRKRGLKLIESGVARLISDDDLVSEDTAMLSKKIGEQDEKINKLENEIETLKENEGKIIAEYEKRLKFSGMTIEELKTYAAENSIYLGVTNKKSDIIELIIEHETKNAFQPR